MSSLGPILLCLGVLLTGCKTLDQNSQTAAWALNGNEQAAKDFIVSTVTQFLPDTKGHPDVLNTFASALVNQKTDQSESAEYVLQTYYEQDRKSENGRTDDPLQQYILSQFFVLTTYLSYHSDPKSKALSYVQPKSR